MYCLVHESQYGDIPDSYDKGNVSKLVPYKIIDKADMDMATWCNTDMNEAPQFIKDLTYKCCFGQEIAVNIRKNTEWARMPY